MIRNAYYSRQPMYTLVPRHVREDMEWMASIGTNTVIGDPVSWLLRSASCIRS